MTRLIILASGRDEPFEGYDVPKHLLPINGEPILHRQIRQWVDRGIDDIRIAGPYRHLSARTFNPRTQPDDVDIASSVLAWNPDGRTIVTYGDCVYTEQACDAIVGIDYERYLHFCRPHDRERVAEGLAVSFYPEQHEFLRHNIERLPHLVAADVTWRADGWAISRLMDRVSLDRLGEHDPYLKCYVVIDDESDDIDTPEEYEAVKAAFESRSGPMTFAVGLPDAAEWSQMSPQPDAKMLQHASIDVEAVTDWVGIPPPPESARRINLCAPIEGADMEPQWLEFEPFACWTTDLVAVRFP